MMRSDRTELLFSKADAFSVQEFQRKALQKEIEGLDGNRLLNTNVDDLVDYVVQKFRVDVPELDESSMSVDQSESSRDVSRDPMRAAHYFHDRGPLLVTGTEVVVEVPFVGDAQLFWVRPSTFNTAPPRAEVGNQSITFRYWSDKPSTEEMRGSIDRWLADVKQYLQWHRETFRGFNNELSGTARSLIAHRREKLLASQNAVAALGIPLKRRAGAPTTYAAPEVKRKITPKLPPATSGPHKAEPILEEDEYQHILDIVESMVKVMERSPTAFHQITEEALRTHFLVQLNGHYEGQATGETFNYEGKTDILIRSGDRNVFIAECKFWSGPSKVTETINQLLGYLSWRDSKAAILLFNRNKDFSKVLAAIPEAVKTHPNLQKDEGQRGQTGFRYAFRHKDDPAKVLHITILAFDVPQS